MSDHLDQIFKDQEGISSAQVAFCDIVSYSSRRSIMQKRDNC